jgi:hypothetical protein
LRAGSRCAERCGWVRFGRASQRRAMCRCVWPGLQQFWRPRGRAVEIGRTWRLCSEGEVGWVRCLRFIWGKMSWVHWGSAGWQYGELSPNNEQYNEYLGRELNILISQVYFTFGFFSRGQMSQTSMYSLLMDRSLLQLA